MSSRYYLPLRHDVVAKHVYEKLRKKQNKDSVINYIGEEFIETDNEMQYWWNVSIKTPTKVRHNKPDLLIWNNLFKTCSVCEISCPADVNVSKKIREKEDKYGPLMRMLQIMYPEYKFNFIPIVVGALGSVPKSLATNLQTLGFDNKESRDIVYRLQQKSVIGTVKIVKTFMNFKT